MSLSLWHTPYVVSAPAEPTSYFQPILKAVSSPVDPEKVKKVSLRVSADIMKEEVSLESTTIPLISPEIGDKPGIDEMLDRLAMCESSGNEKVVVMDVNSRYSYSTFQYQKSTWLLYTKKYGMEGADIMDGDAQRKLTKIILENEPNSWRNWANCARKIGLDRF